MTGTRKTRWEGNGMSMRSWRRCWNEEGWKEALCRWKSCKRYQSELYMSECPRLKKTKCAKEQKKVKGWSTEEMKENPSSSAEEDTEEKKNGEE